jgi:hypothetical protein
MADLVTEVAEQGAIRLMHGASTPLALGIIRLRKRAIVISPLSCPVMTVRPFPCNGTARKSKRRRSAELSPLLSSGSFSRRSVQNSLCFAAAILRQANLLSAQLTSGIVLLCRHVRQ